MVGDTTMEEILPVLNDAFGNWAEDRRAIPRKNLAEVALADSSRVVIIDKPGSPQSLILAGWRGMGDKATFKAQQNEAPLLVSMGLDEQRGAVIQGES